ncbi:MAG: 50S ribosomal protein L31e [Desulfurococcales archaeon]|nr:50S ribosomal protein L31e [Desulfurococcales archaeon]
MPDSDYYVYVVPLKRVYWGRRTNRADRAVRLLKMFVRRHMKVDDVIISNEVNNYIWSRGREKPPRRIKILVSVKEEKEEEGEGKVRIAVVRLAGAKLKPGPYTPTGSKEKKRKS